MTQNNPFAQLLAKRNEVKGTTQKAVGGLDPVRHEKMINWYLDLAEQKRITPKDLNEFSATTLFDEIQHLRDLPYPASQGQLDRINALTEEISLIKGKKMKVKYDLTTLTGGRDGSASKVIESLIKYRKGLRDIAPATDHQIETVLEWKLCPDIPFEEHNIQFRVYLEDTQIDCVETRSTGSWTYKPTIKMGSHVQSFSTGEVEEVMEQVSITSKKTGLWRVITDTEFAEQIKANFTEQQLNEFISTYRGTFYSWKSARITKSQMGIIRDIERELAQIGTPLSREVAVDFEGNEMDYSTFDSRTRRTVIDTAYTPLSEEQLLQMSTEDATRWIGRLSMERDNKALASIGSIFDESQEELADKFKKYDDMRTRSGNAYTLSDAQEKEYQALDNLIFSLESVVGYANEEVHALIKASIVYQEDKKFEQAKQAVKDLMFATVCLTRGADYAYKTVGTLFTLTEDTMIGTAIAEEVKQIVDIYFN